MAYDFLKKLFGEPKEGEAPKTMTYAELEAAIDADNGIKVADLAAGGYVAKDKFDGKVQELAGVRQQLNDANAQIQSFKDQDVDGIKAKVTEWETKYNTDTKALQDKLDAQARSHAEDMFMSGYNFTSKAARNGILAELRAKNLKVEDGQLLGAKEIMDSLMANDDYKGAFVTEDKPDTAAQGAGVSNQQPRFATGTNGGSAPAGEQNPFLAAMHFNYVKQPSSAHN